jgi:hypothetical protein
MNKLPIACLGIALLSAGCVGAQRFRYVQHQPECFADRTDPFPGVTGERRSWASLDCSHALYRVGFIEFLEDGAAVEPLQEQKALTLIDEARRQAPGGKVITLVYVHGWKNNASEAAPGGAPKDVEKFKNALTELGYRSFAVAKLLDDRDPTPIPVVGIYLAWRGKSLKGPSWFTFPSYWPRRNTANHVGDGPDFAPTLNRIIAKVNEGDTGSRVALIGHSFGARVLEHAIERTPGGVQLYTAPTAGATSDAERLDPLVDLTLYVNSANDARLSMARVQSLRANPVRVRHPDYKAADCAQPTSQALPDARPNDDAQCRDYPLIVAITSRGDLATKYLLPAANTIAADAKSAPVPPQPTGQYLDTVPSPGVYRRSAAGHMRFMQSHVVREIRCPAIPDPVLDPSGDVDVDAPADERARRAAIEARTYAFMHPACTPGDAQCRFVFRTQDESPACFQVDQRVPAKVNATTLDPFNTTAFWIMDVDPVVIHDHGDIWNLSFVEMLAQLMAPRGFFDPRSGRVQLRAQ